MSAPPAVARRCRRSPRPPCPNAPKPFESARKFAADGGTLSRSLFWELSRSLFLGKFASENWLSLRMQLEMWIEVSPSGPGRKAATCRSLFLGKFHSLFSARCAMKSFAAKQVDRLRDIGTWGDGEIMTERRFAFGAPFLTSKERTKAMPVKSRGGGENSIFLLEACRMMEIGPKLFDKVYKSLNIRCIQYPNRKGRLFHKGDVREAYAKLLEQAGIEAGRAEQRGSSPRGKKDPEATRGRPGP